MTRRRQYLYVRTLVQDFLQDFAKVLPVLLKELFNAVENNEDALFLE